MHESKRSRFALTKAALRAVVGGVCLSGIAASVCIADDEAPTRARDLMYGESLFNYYQGHSFEALTLLNVAKSRGGIAGHGSHPLLVEGGLMLAYGMTREAQRHFESVLSEELNARVPEDVRNQAWFYLGKVFYLEQDYRASMAALDKVALESLEESDAALYQEWLYLRAQLALQAASATASSDQAASGQQADLDTWIDKLPKDSLWPVYLRYNRAIQSMQSGDDFAMASNSLETLLADLEAMVLTSLPLKNEQEALLERIRLSLGQGYLQSGEFEAAERHLKKASLEGPFAEQALFNFSVVATQLERYELALSALNRLSGRPLFTPWLEQVPYALAYLYEKLGDLELALQAYEAAGARYDQQIAILTEQKETLNESTLLKALAAPLGRSVTGNKGQALKLGSTDLENDAYGRLKVKPVDFAFAQLLANETFQLGLRDLHELYKLKSSLDTWHERLQSFELMLDTRELQREQRLRVVSESLASQQADRWIETQALYAREIEQALAREDLRFFMDENQMEFAGQIASARETLALLPEDEDKAEYAQKLARMSRFFEWSLANQYGKNRWDAQKQLKALNVAMAEFRQRHEKLKYEIDNNDFQIVLAERVTDGEARIDALAVSLDKALVEAQSGLLALVAEELDLQINEVKRYRLASRHAQARLADLLYQSLQNPESGDQPTVPEGATGQEQSEPAPLSGERNDASSNQSGAGDVLSSSMCVSDCTSSKSGVAS